MCHIFRIFVSFLLCIHCYYEVSSASTDLSSESCAGTPTAFTNYSLHDFVIVSIRAMCSTEMSLKRIMNMYNPRRIHYITGDPSECPSLRNIMKDERFQCLDENAIFTTPKSALKDNCLALTRDTKKSFGWHMQQFVKLGVSRHLSDLSEKYIIFDADNIITYPFDMMDEEGKVMLPHKSVAAARIGGYGVFYEKTLQRKATPKNYVIGHMLVEKYVVLEMLDEIDRAWGSIFPKSVCDVALRFNFSQINTHFSEYCFYSSFLKEKYPEKVGREYLWGPPRNPAKYQALASKGDCCVQEAAICQSYRNADDFYVIIEEHKYRYRDDRCTDNWKLGQ